MFQLYWQGLGSLCCEASASLSFCGNGLWERAGCSETTSWNAQALETVSVSSGNHAPSAPQWDRVRWHERERERAREDNMIKVICLSGPTASHQCTVGLLLRLRTWLSYTSRESHPRFHSPHYPQGKRVIGLCNHITPSFQESCLLKRAPVHSYDCLKRVKGLCIESDIPPAPEKSTGGIFSLECAIS